MKTFTQQAHRLRNLATIREAKTIEGKRKALKDARYIEDAIRSARILNKIKSQINN